MGLNLTVQGGNRGQGAQEADSSPQQQERKAKHHSNTDEIYPLEAFDFGLRSIGGHGGVTCVHFRCRSR